jgi:gas vesicle protein
MTDELDIELSQASFKKKALIVGPLLGAAIGFVSAYLLIQSMEKRDTELKISASEGVSMALIVMALIRQIAELPDKRK